MPRELSGFFEAEILKKDTQPGWLIEIQLAVDNVLRFCTTGEVEWDEELWIGYGASVQWANGGLPRIVLPNHDNSGTALLQANDLVDKRVIVYNWYPSEARPLFSGFLSLSSVDYSWAYFATSYSRTLGTKAPAGRVSAPKFTRRLVPGQTLKFYDASIEVTAYA